MFDGSSGSIEKTKLKTPAVYSYTELLPRTFFSYN